MVLKGSISPPGDKSISHRLALMSLLAEGGCRLENMASGQDVSTSLKAAARLGAQVSGQGTEYDVIGAGRQVTDTADIDCGNSGTTMRLLMGLLAGLPGNYTLTGDDSLSRRPMERVAAPLRRMGAQVECTDGHAPVSIKGGGLTGLEFQSPVASAQLKSAVLLAGLQAEGITTVQEPSPSRDHTERLISLMGGTVSLTDGRWRVEKSALTLPSYLRVPGDPSSAAFFLCAAAVIPGSEVAAEGVLLNPTRIGFVEVLRRMGALIKIETLGEQPEPWGRITVSYSPDLTGCRVPGEEIPSLVDEVPILSLAATQARGETVFEQVGELRIKETDRLAAIESQLGLMGARVSIQGDNLAVAGPTPLTAPDRLDSFGDHRLAMTLRLAGLLAKADPFIREENCAAISYPAFREDLKALIK